MNNKNFIRGVEILAKHVDPEEYGVAARHDQLFFGSSKLKLTAAEKKELRALDWFVDEGSWSCFT